MDPVFFKNQKEFRKWLEKNHLTEKELTVGYYKVQTGKPSVTWSESVDQAICFGWIDGVRKSIDDTSYSIRFTPRKPSSNWSAVNIEKAGRLKSLGLMFPAGLEAFDKRSEERSRIYSFESEEKKLSKELETQFMINKKAWDFFNLQAQSYRKTALHWICSAKTEETQRNRLNKIIEASEKKQRLWK
jgi:uncharacterized protein YdeI (YjbR/CyaY-like superfamily)